MGTTTPSRTTTLRLKYVPPLDWDFLLSYLERRQSGPVECVDGACYWRAIEIDGDVGTLLVTHDPRSAEIVVNVHGEVRKHSNVIEERVRRLFDLGLRPDDVQSALGADPWLGPLVKAFPGIRLPGAWSPIELIVRTIVGQQVSVSAATTIMGRLVRRLGRSVPSPDGDGEILLFPEPAAIAEADLNGIGMPTRRVHALQCAARLIADRGAPRQAAGEGVGEIKEALLELPGIGPWTVEYFALRALRDADAWPGTDLVLRRAVAQLPLMRERVTVRHVTNGWRPYRGYAAIHLWHAASAGIDPWFRGRQG